MEDTTVKVLSDEYLEFAYTLRELGVDWKVSYLIAYLANVGEAYSKEIKKGTSLSQPEISIAMHTLRDNNWVEERALKTFVKGRPAKIYALSTPIDEIIKHYEDEKKREFGQTMETIQKLKELSRLNTRDRKGSG